MKSSNEPFIDLVKEARDGSLQLPAFQRDFKWSRSNQERDNFRQI